MRASSRPPSPLWLANLQSLDALLGCSDFHLGVNRAPWLEPPPGKKKQGSIDRTPKKQLRNITGFN